MAVPFPAMLGRGCTVSQTLEWRRSTVPEDSAAESGQATVQTPTPDCVNARVFHEEDITPGAICRQYFEDDDGESSFSDWFVVVSEPQVSKHGSEYVDVVWLEGTDKGLLDRHFLRDLGVKPPYRAVCEKHSLEIPEKYIAPRGVLAALSGWLP